MDFNLSFKKKSSDLSLFKDIPNHDTDFLKAIDLFKSQREECGLTLEDLARMTKISRNVLVAIENGWKKYLPEKTYLTSMIKKLETEMNLERGSLDGLLTHKITVKNLSRFRFININFLTSWVGSLIYLILMFLSILALNSQQQYLLKINSLSTEPLFQENNSLGIELKDNNQQKE